MVVGLFLALTAPLVAIGHAGFAERWDEQKYHLPVIREFAAAWPDVDLVHYGVAMTPGWHLVMAMVLRATGSEIAMRWANLAVGLAVVVVLFLMVRRAAPGWLSAALVAPVLCSKILIGASTSLTTDNACWAVALGALWCAVLAPARPRTMLLGGACGVAAVMTRQVCVWIAAPFGLVMVAASPLGALVPRMIRPEVRGNRWVVMLSAAAACAGIFGVVLGFVAMWGGTVPDHPEMRAHFERGYAGATFAFALAFVAVYGVWFLPIVWAQVKRLRITDAWAWASVMLGLVCAAVPETGWAARHRSAGIVWRMAEVWSKLGGGRMEGTEVGAPMVGSRLDPIDGRSGFVMIAAPIGALIVLLLVRGAASAGRGVQARILALSLLGLVITQGFSVMVGQRYYEPFLLSGLVVMAALAVRPDQRARWWWAAGPLVLGAAQGALTAAGIFGEAPGAGAG